MCVVAQFEAAEAMKEREGRLWDGPVSGEVEGRGY